MCEYKPLTITEAASLIGEVLKAGEQKPQGVYGRPLKLDVFNKRIGNLHILAPRKRLKESLLYTASTKDIDN